MIELKRHRDGPYIAPLTDEQLVACAEDLSSRGRPIVRPSEVYLYTSTLEACKAGRLPTRSRGVHLNPDRWMRWGIDGDEVEGIPADRWLDHLFKATHYRRQLFEREPNPDPVPHFVVQQGGPRALLYAVKTSGGIKVGKTGTGDSCLVKQAEGRFGQYKSISPVEIIGLAWCWLKDVEAAEKELHASLSSHRLDFGEEMFADTPEVRGLLFEEFRSCWHCDYPLATRKERAGWWRDDGRSRFTSLKGKTYTHDLPWRDYIRLLDEIHLIDIADFSYLDGLDEELMEIVQEHWAENHAGEDDPPDFGESEDDDLGRELVKIYLPASESLYPQARKRFDAADQS